MRRSRRRLLAIAGVGLLAWAAAVAMWSWLRTQVGEPREAITDAWHVGHRIEDRHGVVLRDLPSDELGRRGRPIALADMGERLVLATLAAEDADFFDHDGIDRTAILRAALDNATSGRVVSGASTITQQLVKLLDTRGVAGPRDLTIKLREAARAQNLEAVLTKDEILAEYCNRLPYGRGLVGPEAAARGYFGVAPADLSWAQAAFLAVIPRAPSRLDPIAHGDRVLPRAHAVLHALHDAGTLDDAALARALAEEVAPRPVVQPFSAPHFVETLRSEGRLSDEPVTRTTLDLALQTDVEGLVATHMRAMVQRGALDAAAIVVDNATGEILAWVGSAEFWSEAIAGQVDMVRSLRQPGSALKPFVYALAFSDGRSGAGMLADVPTVFREGAGHAWAPDNFHRDFVGPVAAREALAASLNVPAVRLLDEVGRDRLLSLLRALGLASLRHSADHYGLSLALGSGEVAMRELAGAYVALARGGSFVPLRYTLDEPSTAPTQVLAVDAAAAVTEALADPLTRARLLPGASPFSIGFPVALKTGTSTGYRDAWTAGYTRERTVVVWVGNADGRPTDGVTGATGAGGLFADIMRRTMRDVPTHRPLWDEDALVDATVCPLSGLRPGPACPHAVQRRVAASAVPQQACTLHVHARADVHGALTCDPSGDTTVVALPDTFDRFLHALPLGAPGKDPDGLPWLAASSLPGCAPQRDGPPVLAVTEPAAGEVVWGGGGRDRVALRAELTGGDAALRDGAIEFVVDGTVVATVDPPWSTLVELPRGDHEVVARPVDPRARVRVSGVPFAVR